MAYKFYLTPQNDILQIDEFIIQEVQFLRKYIVSLQERMLYHDVYISKGAEKFLEQVFYKKILGWVEGYMDSTGKVLQKIDGVWIDTLRLNNLKLIAYNTEEEFQIAHKDFIAFVRQGKKLTLSKALKNAKSYKRLLYSKKMKVAVERHSDGTIKEVYFLDRYLDRSKAIKVYSTTDIAIRDNNHLFNHFKRDSVVRWNFSDKRYHSHKNTKTIGKNI